MKYKPYQHQQKSINEIQESFIKYDRVLYQLPTGGGKTVVFSNICKDFNGKVLVLCHRTELVNQSIKTMSNLGLTVQRIDQTTKRIDHNVNVYVAMIQTLDNRLKKNVDYIKDIGLIICDECHILIFNKVFDYFSGAKILGCSATPHIMAKKAFFKCNVCKKQQENSFKCCGRDSAEWVKRQSMSDYYETIVIGEDISKLVIDGFLVPEVSFKVKETSINSDSGDEFTKHQLKKEFSSFNPVRHYKERILNKKTIVFNSSSEENKRIHEQFISEGFNSKMYDSVNSDTKDRKDILEWFKNTDNAILNNVDVFTTGFDEPSVSAIILNTATNSLTKYLQMVGRGGRLCSGKFSFILLDGGGNIDRFGAWSGTRDWGSIFYGEGEPKPKIKKEHEQDIQMCPDCGVLSSRIVSNCECGYVFEYLSKKINSDSNEELVAVDVLPLPNPESIYNYTKSKGGGFAFAYNVLIGWIVDLFILNNVSTALYFLNVQRDKLFTKIRDIVRPCRQLFELKGDLTGVRKTNDYIYEKVKYKLDLYYTKNK